MKTIATALLLGLVACGGPELPEAVGIGGDFTLTDTTGARWEMSSLRGQPVVMFFGFTACPDFCPITLAEFAEAHELLGEDAAEVRTVFISVDPDRDTPELLASYLDAFDLPVIGLTGSAEELATIGRLYAASWDRVEDDSRAGYTIEHSVRTYVLDREGVVRWAIPYEEGAEVLENALRIVLAN